MRPCIEASCSEPRLPMRLFCAAHASAEPSQEERWALGGLPDYGVRTDSGSAAMVCPHCQVRGRVTTERIKVKRGISGGKATGAVLTAGLSLFATGLSRKEYVTRARCGNCHQVWTY